MKIKNLKFELADVRGLYYNTYFDYVHITKGSVSTAFTPTGFLFFKPPS